MEAGEDIADIADLHKHALHSIFCSSSTSTSFTSRICREIGSSPNLLVDILLIFSPLLPGWVEVITQRNKEYLTAWRCVAQSNLAAHTESNRYKGRTEERGDRTGGWRWREADQMG